MKKNLFFLTTTLLIIIFSLSACSFDKENKKSQKNSEDKLTIYTTIYPLQYFTERIGGNFVITKNIVPKGADAHSTDINLKTMSKVSESDAFIYTGTGLEGYANAVTDTLKGKDVLIVNASKNIQFKDSSEIESDSDEIDEHDDHSTETDVDPHVWLDPIRSITLAENIKNSLVKLEPSNKEAFEKNFEDIKKELEDLDSEFKDVITQSKRKTFIVSHSAYGYWEEIYGLKQIGISGLSPTNEPSQKQLKNIIDLVLTNKLQYIFFEPNVSNKIAEIVKNETDTKTLTLQNLESLTSKNKKNNEDYFIVMQNNIEALRTALN